jgi:hypothetical protein
VAASDIVLIGEMAYRRQDAYRVNGQAINLLEAAQYLLDHHSENISSGRCGCGDMMPCGHRESAVATFSRYFRYALPARPCSAPRTPPR